MKIIDYSQIPKDIKRSVVSVGNFDGIHKGHVLLIKTVCDHARAYGADSVIITFEPHTREVLSPENPLKRLTTFEEKLFLIKDLHPDYVISLPFDKYMAAMDPQEFVTQILMDKFKTIEWVAGENHTFGKDRKGNYKYLHSFSGMYYFNMFLINLQMTGAAVVSSSGIRNHVMEGNMDAAAAMLGHPYLLLSKRIHGKKRGSVLGVPTINVKNPPSPKVMPPEGIYAGELEWGTNKIRGALYYGRCPTFKERVLHLEFHAIDPLPDEPAYESPVALWIHSFIRKDMLFPSSQALVEQMHKDTETVKHFFEKE